MNNKKSLELNYKQAMELACAVNNKIENLKIDYSRWEDKRILLRIKILEELLIKIKECL